MHSVERYDHSNVGDDDLGRPERERVNAIAR